MDSSIDPELIKQFKETDNVLIAVFISGITQEALGRLGQKAII